MAGAVKGLPIIYRSRSGRRVCSRIGGSNLKYQIRRDRLRKNDPLHLNRKMVDKKTTIRLDGIEKENQAKPRVYGLIKGQLLIESVKLIK